MKTINIDSPEEAVAAAPHLVGFYPSDSCVIMWMQDGSLRLTQRSDIEHMANPGNLVAGVRNGFTDAVVISFSDRHWHEEFDKHAALALNLKAAGVNIGDVIHFDGEHYYCYEIPLSEPALAFTGTISAETKTRWSAEFGYMGRASFSTRDDLAALIAPSKVYIEPAEHPADLRAQFGEVEARAYLLDTAIECHLAPVADYNVDLALVVAALDDIHLRDALLITIASSNDMSILDTLYQACRITMAEHSAPILTIAAIAAYMFGEGAMANICVDAALAIDKDYSLATLADSIFRVGLSPEEMRGMFTALDLDEIMANGAGS